MLQSFFVLCLCHLFNDFTVQTDSFIERKKVHGTKGYFAIGVHSAAFLALCLLVLAWLGKLSFVLAFGILVISGIHYGIDLAKVKLEQKFVGNYESIQQDPWSGWLEWIKIGFKKIISNKLALFIGDQFLHFFSIVTVLQIIYTKHLIDYLVFLDKLTINLAISQIVKAPEYKYLLTGIVLILLTSFANVFIQVLDLNDDIGVNHGAYIGVTERILVVLGVIAGQYQPLAIMFGAKAAMRFKEANEKKQVAEYFLIGSFVSAVFGVICGILLKMIYWPR